MRVAGPALAALVVALPPCSADCPELGPPPGCARCAEIEAGLRPPGYACHNPPSFPGVDSAILWEGLESCLCEGPCSEACGPACLPPYLISPADITGPCEQCEQTAGHGPDDPEGCGRVLQLCALDAPLVPLLP